MQLINHPDTFRKNLLVGLAVGTGAVASGCGTPEPASLENANRGEIDYSKVDYSKLDYSKVEAMGEYCDPTLVPGKELGIEVVNRLDKAIEAAYAAQLDKEVINVLVVERKAVLAGNDVFANFGDILCW